MTTSKASLTMEENFSFLAEMFFLNPIGESLLTQILMSIGAMGQDGARYIFNSPSFEDIIKNAYITHKLLICWVTKKLKHSEDSAEILEDEFIASMKEEMLRYAMRRFSDMQKQMGEAMKEQAGIPSESTPTSNLGTETFDLANIIRNIQARNKTDKSVN